MKRKPTVSLADDRRARVPFALVAVVLLTTSVVTASIINQRSTPEVDVSPDLIHERTTLAAQSVISEAASDAIAEAGEEPVTSVDGSSSSLDEIYEWEQNSGSDGGLIGYPIRERVINYDEYPVRGALARGTQSADEVFKRYVKLRIYIKVDKRLRDSTQTISRPNGEVRGEVFLPPLENDYESINESLDRITLDIGGDGNDLDRGEYRISIEEVQHTVSVGDNEIHQEQQSYDVTGKTAVFEMHSQVSEYQNRLDDVEKYLYAYIYPLLHTQATIEAYLGDLIESWAWDKHLSIQELISFTNLINYDMQEATFGTADQSHDSMTRVANACLAYYYAGPPTTSLVAGGIASALPQNMIPRANLKVLRKFNPKKFKDEPGIKLDFFKAVPMDVPYNGLCYFTTYAEVPQATTTATTDLPSVAGFADDETEWESREDLYREIGPPEEQSDFSVSPSGLQNVVSEGREGQTSHITDAIGNGPNSKETVEIGEFANATYRRMFDIDGNQEEVETTVEVDGEEYDISDIEEETGMDTGIDLEDDSDDDDGISATEAEREDVNRLRKQLIEDVDPIEVTRTQLLTSDDIFGGMIYQIEQNSDGYIFGDRYQTNAYGLRNAYLQQVISSIEESEERRREAAERFEEMAGNESVEELLTIGQAALEGEADNPDRIREIADNTTYDSDRPGADRFDLDNVERNLLVWWEEKSDDYLSSRWDSASKEPDGIPSEVELDDSGIPEEITENMLYKFGDGELPKSTDVTTSVRISLTDLPAEEGDDGFAPNEIDEENRTDEAYIWNIRPVNLDKDIYRVTNGQLINRTFGDSKSVYREIDGVYRPVDTRTYLQLHRVNASMNLTDEAKEEVGLSSPCDRFPGYICDPSDHERTVTKDRYVLTAVDVPQEEDTEEGIDIDEEELAVPELRPADKEDFQFNVHASPGYLSGLPIVRQTEPSVRAPGKGPLHGRNAPFTPLSARTVNGLNPGLPLVPLFPPTFDLWLLSANMWQSEVKGEYARFELRSDTSNGLDTGPENYVRQDMTVELDINGQSTPVGSVEPISLEAWNLFPMLAPGFGVTSKAPPQESTSFGTGDNVNLISANIQPIPGGSTYRPTQCTAGWPNVGPGASPLGLERACGNPGPIGDALSSQLGGRVVQGAAISHAMIVNEPEDEEAAQKAEELCKLDEPCPDIGPRDRNSNA